MRNRMNLEIKVMTKVLLALEKTNRNRNNITKISKKQVDQANLHQVKQEHLQLKRRSFQSRLKITMLKVKKNSILIIMMRKIQTIVKKRENPKQQITKTSKISNSNRIMRTQLNLGTISLSK
jgi:hypothetical protein